MKSPGTLVGFGAFLWLSVFNHTTPEADSCFVIEVKYFGCGNNGTGKAIYFSLRERLSLAFIILAFQLMLYLRPRPKPVPPPALQSYKRAHSYYR